MTTERNYRCNLCHATISKDRDNTLNGSGIHHHHHVVEGQTVPAIKLVHCRDAENHICSPCYRALFAQRLGGN